MHDHHGSWPLSNNFWAILQVKIAMKDEHKLQFILNIKHCYPDIVNISLHLSPCYTNVYSLFRRFNSKLDLKM